MNEEQPEPLTLYSTWRGLVVMTITPVLLMGLGISAMIWAGRVAIVALIISVVGFVLGAVGLFDLPRWCVFTAEGISRRCPLRNHKLGWDRVHAIARAPGNRTFGPRLEGASRMTRTLGGLTAVVGKRRYLLVDTAEGAEEFAHLVRCVDAWAPGVALRAPAPPDEASPTWIYHERRDK